MYDLGESSAFKGVIGICVIFRALLLSLKVISLFLSVKCNIRWAFFTHLHSCKRSMLCSICIFRWYTPPHYQAASNSHESRPLCCFIFQWDTGSDGEDPYQQESEPDKFIQYIPYISAGFTTIFSLEIINKIIGMHFTKMICSWRNRLENSILPTASCLDSSTHFSHRH